MINPSLHIRLCSYPIQTNRFGGVESNKSIKWKIQQTNNVWYKLNKTQFDFDIYLTDREEETNKYKSWQWQVFCDNYLHMTPDQGDGVMV